MRQLARPTGGKSNETKKLILDKATKIFEYKGYTATSMEDIRSETKLSKGTVYYHFKNKEDLYLYCISQASISFVEKWNKLSNNEATAIDKLHLWGKLYGIEMQQPLTKTIPEYVASTKEFPLANSILELFEPEFNIIRLLLIEGKESGEFARHINIDNVSVILYNLVSNLSISPIFGYDSEDLQVLFKDAINVALHGIKA
ncbi:TetR/AcrR family transcriptional regulator [Paenibacillus rhizosphaerae]|uniref:TetR/AcrR family transcriptional regulator n=1 Tax=Paenibacillus rhizosphaerae TaxID=297318 RepID=UPI0028AE23CB|nr:TetR/AcrR family transcriptional regulator [Paenibacillus rhizosphaerae]